MRRIDFIKTLPILVFIGPFMLEIKPAKKRKKQDFFVTIRFDEDKIRHSSEQEMIVDINRAFDHIKKTTIKEVIKFKKNLSNDHSTIPRLF